MSNRTGHSISGTHFRRGFSLIEILTTVALLSVIILGLVAMFDQTRKAFTSSMTQTDVLEAGRNATDIVGRELEQASAVDAFLALNGSNIYNFYMDSPYSASAPLRQPLVDPNDFRTNNLQRVYFVTGFNKQWNSIGYLVLPTFAGNGIGTLYRYCSNGIPTSNLTNLWASQTYFFNQTPPTNGFSRIIDGVVNFRIRTYGPGGGQFYYFCASNGLSQVMPLAARINSAANAAIFVQPNVNTADQLTAQFTGTGLPGYVDVEIGVLEDRTLARYNSLTNVNPAMNGPGSPAWNYLTNHAGQVHVFRQRIPIRNLDPLAYQ